MLEQKKREFSKLVKNLQNQICQKMRQLDPKIELKEDIWTRTDFEGKAGGGGITRAFAG
ncbi:MAG: hypothetical protein WEB87_06415 [Bacteriovoracaceae bacterium]